MISTTINSKIKTDLPFPKLMISKEPEDGVYTVILAIDSDGGNITGVCLTECIGNEIGDYDCNWAGHVFEDFKGEIKLSNK